MKIRFFFKAFCLAGISFLLSYGFYRLSGVVLDIPSKIIAADIPINSVGNPDQQEDEASEDTEDTDNSDNSDHRDDNSHERDEDDDVQQFNV
jgi:hypothetical protein